MNSIVSWLGALFPRTPGTRPGTRSPGRRRFQPQNPDSLEQRTTPSAFLPTHPLAARSPLHVRRRLHRPAFTSPMTERHNVAFPTIGGQSELLDVYMPNGPAPAGGRPVILAIHGGGWRRFNKSAYGSRVANAFVRDGYVVVAPNYALSAPGSPSWPENLADVQAAVRWVRTNAQALGVNSNEIAAMGESAGANLAALLGTSREHVRTRRVRGRRCGGCVVDAGGPDKPLPPEPSCGSGDDANARGLARATTGRLHRGLARPSGFAGHPPMLLIQGRQDPLIPVNQSRELQTALAADGMRNQLILVNGGHDLNFPPQYPELVASSARFSHHHVA